MAKTITKTSLLMMLFVVSSVPFLEVVPYKNTVSANSMKNLVFVESLSQKLHASVDIINKQKDLVFPDLFSFPNNIAEK